MLQFRGLVKSYPNLLQRILFKVSGSAFGAKLGSVLMHHIDQPVLKLTKGRFAPSGILFGLPVATLTTTGAKSGLARSVPLLVIPDGDKLFLVASNWGGPLYPAWYHNLRANPQAAVTMGGATQRYRAHQVEGDEYARYWRKAVERYPGYEAYKARTGRRPIPVMVLEKI